MTTFFQNLAGTLSDPEVYTREPSIAVPAKSSGFERVRTAANRFDDRTMCQNPLQSLSSMAKPAQRTLPGTMAMALPGHDPVHIAENITGFSYRRVRHESAGASVRTAATRT